MSSSETPSRVPDFGRRAPTYDRVRPVDANWWEVLGLLEREVGFAGRRVLDIGCGTGRLVEALAARGARVWGVDPSPEMLAEARAKRPRGAGLKRGRAESLPFTDGWFDRAVMWLVAHLVDRPRAFREARRVLAPGGLLAVVTFEPSSFSRYWLNRFFPSIERIDRARFPSEESLRADLAAAGFAEVRFVRLAQRGSLSRAEALERVRGRHISTFDLLDEEELRVGSARAESELAEQVDYEIDWLLALAER